MNPQPGEVWLADLGLAAETRPVIVVSRFDGISSRNRDLCSTHDAEPVEPLTRWRCHDLLFLTETPWRTCRDWPRFQRFGWNEGFGRVPAATMQEVKAALVFALDLE